MTLRLNPSAFVPPALPFGVMAGRFWLPVPGFQCAEVSTYPLIVVVDSAVNTAFVRSSARATAGRLTTPAPIKAKVHALYFIFHVYWFTRFPPHHPRSIHSAATPGTFCRRNAPTVPT